VLLPTRIIRIGVKVMVRPRLEVIYIGYMFTRGREKMVPKLSIFNHMIMGIASITGRG